MEDEIGKYRSKKPSNVSKVFKKSRHKHIYKPCLLDMKFKVRDREVFNMCGSSYCTVCGKIGNRMIDEDMIKENGYIRSLTREELLKLYDGYPIFEVDDVFSGYVPIEVINGKGE